MRLLVTGGAGFIGSHLVDRLVAAGYGRITVLDNLRRGCIGNLAESRKRIRFLEGDIRDLDWVRRAMRGVGIVYHLAAQSNVLGARQDEDYSFTTNVAGTLNVLRAARDSGVKRLLFTSSREVYGDPESIPVPESAPLAPKNGYGASKMAGEAYCRAFQGQGMDICIVRPGQRLRAARLRPRDPRVHRGGDARRTAHGLRRDANHRFRLDRHGCRNPGSREYGRRVSRAS